MLACNGVMLSAFVRSMHRYGSLLATVANNGANFIATVCNSMDVGETRLCVFVRVCRAEGSVRSVCIY